MTDLTRAIVLFRIGNVKYVESKYFSRSSKAPLQSNVQKIYTIEVLINFQKTKYAAHLQHKKYNEER